jgi:hypothetical protein
LKLSPSFFPLLFFFAYLHICIIHCVVSGLGDFLSFCLPLPDFLEIIDLLMIPIFTFS